MGVVVQFPQRRKPQSFGLYTQEELIVAEHLVRQGKARYVPLWELPEHEQRTSLGEYVKAAAVIEGHAINEFTNLCYYMRGQRTEFSR